MTHVENAQFYRIMHCKCYGKAHMLAFDSLPEAVDALTKMEKKKFAKIYRITTTKVFNENMEIISYTENACMVEEREYGSGI